MKPGNYDEDDKNDGNGILMYIYKRMTKNDYWSKVNGGFPLI